MLTRLVLLSWVTPPKKSDCSNFFQLLQLDLQGSSLASKCLCSARTLTLIPARWFPWETLPQSKGRRSLVCCPEASQGWYAVDSSCTGLRCLWMVTWYCICTGHSGPAASGSLVVSMLEALCQYISQQNTYSKDTAVKARQSFICVNKTKIPVCTRAFHQCLALLIPWTETHVSKNL